MDVGAWLGARELSYPDVLMKEGWGETAGSQSMKVFPQ